LYNSAEVSAVLKTIEATLDPEGTIRFSEPIHLTQPRRVLVTLLDDEIAPSDEEVGNVARMLALLATPSFRDRPVASAKELDVVAEQNCNTGIA
jgi:hypothetical protein